MNEIIEAATREMLTQWGVAGALLILGAVSIWWLVTRLDKLFERLIASQAAQVDVIKSLWERDSATRDKDREMTRMAVQAMQESTQAARESIRTMQESNVVARESNAVARSTTEEFRVALRFIDKHT